MEIWNLIEIEWAENTNKEVLNALVLSLSLFLISMLPLAPPLALNYSDLSFFLNSNCFISVSQNNQV